MKSMDTASGFSERALAKFKEGGRTSARMEIVMVRIRVNKISQKQKEEAPALYRGRELANG